MNKSNHAVTRAWARQENVRLHYRVIISFIILDKNAFEKLNCNNEAKERKIILTQKYLFSSR